MLYADNWIYPQIGRFLTGVGSSAGILGVLTIVRLCFAERQFSRMLGTAVTIGLLGAIYGGRPVAYLMHIFGWQQTVQLILLFGVFLAVTFYFALPKSFGTKSHNDESMLAIFIELFSYRKVLIVALIGALMVGIIEGYADAWGTVSVQVLYGYSKTEAAGLVSLIFFGMAFGAPLLSMFADRFRAHDACIIVSALVMGTLFSAFTYQLIPAFLLAPALWVLGFFCAYQVILIYRATTFAPSSLIGVSSAFTNMIIMTFGYVFHYGISQVIQYNWDGQREAGVPIYNAVAISSGLSVVIIGFVLALLGYSLFMQRLKQKS